MTSRNQNQSQSHTHSQERLTDFDDRPTTPADRLHDTYHGALQHDNVVPPETAFVVGVVRRQQYGFGDLVDNNYRELAPPDALLDDFKAEADRTSHNEAWETVNFADRYREYLTADEPQPKLEDLLDRLRNQQAVWLVCYENTDEKRCHRELLKIELYNRLAQPHR